MKNAVNFLLLTILLFAATTVNALTAGDIAVIGVNTDATKGIVFVALDDIPASTTISFTDNAWNATTETWRSGEGIFTWDNSAITPEGTVVTITLETTFTTDVGSVVTNTSFNMSTSGDQVLCYEGTTAPTSNSDSIWLYGYSTENFAWNDNSNSSDVPTALINASVAMSATTSETDNSYFANDTTAQTAVSVTGTKSELLALFTDNTNYYMNNTGPLTFPAYTITISTGTLATEPSYQPTNLGFNTITNSSLYVTYTAAVGTPNGYIAIRKAGSLPTTNPVDGTAYGTGSPIGDGIVAYSGSATTFFDSSLSSSTTYYYKLFSFNGSGGSTNYLITSPLTGSQTTAINDPYSGYYNSVVGLSGAALKSGLHILIRDTHTTEFGYTSTTEQLRYTDEDSTNTNNIIELYTGWSVPKTAYGTGVTDWNKEHTWSKSHGDFGETAPAGTDLHNLRPCDSTVNSQKSNRDFDEGSTPYTDDSPYNGYSGVTGCYYSTDIWEPRDEDKGDVARIIFYMDTRYEGTDTAYDLEIINTIPSSESPDWLPYYARLTTLLSWHYADPPDSWEMRRNNRIQERQGNRNPFIDHPEYITSIWGGAEAPSVTTTSISDITLTTAIGGGNVISAGSASVTARGVCWNTSGTPTLADMYTTDGSGTGVYASSLSGMSPGQIYYVRAYATNTVGTTYGNEVFFSTLTDEPAAHVTNFTSGTPTSSTIPLTWTDAIADGYLIKGSSVSFAAITAPVDGVAETDGLLVKNIAQGIETFTFMSLGTETTYYFKIYPYTNSGTDIDYKTDGSVPLASATTLNVVELIVLPTSMSFTAAFGTYSSAQSASVTSSGLSAPIDIASAGPYEFCLTESGTYSVTLQVSANYNGIIWIKFHPLTVGTFTEPVTFTSGTYQAFITTTGSSYDPNATTATDLFISEYIEGSSYNKGLEIFNGTGQTVNLQNYRIANYYNGGLTPNVLDLSNIDLINGSCYTIVNNQASPELQALADLVTGNFAISFNGDDAVVLEKTTNFVDWFYVDIFGVIGDDPGSAWTGDGGYTTVNQTLVRRPDVMGGITDNPTGTGPTAFTTLTTEWDNYPSDTYSYFGSHIFTPPGPPAAPLNLVITVSGNDVLISWNNDPTVTSWTVWSSDEPATGFSLRDTVTTNSCTLTGDASTFQHRFYHVIANN